jgi:6-phosphogluconolactonase (cycloisomerase 2 family)
MSRFSLRISRKALLALVLLALAALFSGAGLGPTVAQEAEPARQGGVEINGVMVPFQAEDITEATAQGAFFDSFLYALQDVSGGANHIYGFRADGATGFLTALPGFPVATGGTGTSDTVSERLFYDQANQRLFALNAGSNTLSAYKVNLASGRLTPLPYHNTSLETGQWHCLTVHPSGSPLIVASTGAGQVRSYNVTDTALTQAPGSPYAAQGSIFSCAFSRSGNYVYAGVSNVHGFSVNSGNGQLAALAGSPYSLGSTPVAYATDGAGRFFLANFVANQVRVATSSSGVLTEASGSPFTAGVNEPVHGLVHPAGFYMVADRGGNRVAVYKISGSGSATTLAAVPGSPFATGAGGSLDSHILALHDGGHFLFVANAASRSITRFTVNQSTGVLSSASSTPASFVGATGRITGLAMAPIPAQWPRILVHTDDFSLAVGVRLPEQALHRLALPYSVTYDNNQSSFANRLTTGRWDLAIFMVDSYSVASGTLDALLDYVTQGGRLIIYTWYVEFASGHPLWAKLGFAYQSSITADNGVNVPIYQWDTAHPIFNLPQDVPSPLDWVSSQGLGFIGGQRVQPAAGGAALSGYVASPTANQAALILGNGGRTIYKAFGDTWHNSSDKDGDKIVDAVELWENLIFSMMRTETYLPGVLKPCFGGPGENEPNNGPGTAVGSLCSGAVITGSPKNDAGNEEDWFFIDWGGAGTLTVNVTSFPTQAGLFLYRDSTGNLVGSQQNEGDGTYQVQCVGGACGGGGKYLIRLFVPEAAKAGAPDNYQLTATISP